MFPWMRIHLLTMDFCILASRRCLSIGQPRSWAQSPGSWFYAWWTTEAACASQIRFSLCLRDSGEYRLWIFPTSFMETAPSPSDIKPHGCLLAHYILQWSIAGSAASAFFPVLFACLSASCSQGVIWLRLPPACCSWHHHCCCLPPPPTMAKAEPVLGWETPINPPPSKRVLLEQQNVLLHQASHACVPIFSFFYLYCCPVCFLPPSLLLRCHSTGPGGEGVQVSRSRVLFVLPLTFYIYLSLIPLTLTLLSVACSRAFWQGCQSTHFMQEPHLPTTCLPHLQQIFHLHWINFFLCSKDLHVSISL